MNKRQGKMWQKLPIFLALVGFAVGEQKWEKIVTKTPAETQQIEVINLITRLDPNQARYFEVAIGNN